MIQDPYRVLGLSPGASDDEVKACIVLMPLTYSISDGILMGVISYVLIHLLSGTLKDKDERNNINWATILLTLLFICRYAFL